MKLKKIAKKSLNMFLVTALMVSGLTIDTRTVMMVNAEEITSELPSVTTFATPKQLVSSDNFALHGDYTGTAQKVYFGMNGNSQQTWYIAGSDADNSIVLLCDPARPMAKLVTFENDYVNNKTYNAGWGNYEPSLDEGTQVYPNHYGASDLRMTLKTLETNTSVFSLSEQAMMQTTIIHTKDTKNSCTYSTTDKLYAAYGNIDEPNDTYITVGANSKDSLYGGLKVNLKTGPYAYTNSDEDAFWLRAPFYGGSDRALIAYPGHFVASRNFSKYISVVPAFRMSLSSVLFASAALAASSDASLTDTMTFRVDGQDKIASKAAYTTGGVTVNYDEQDTQVFLYVQDANDVYSVEITRDTTVALSAMTEAGITSLTDGGTKIWLEKSKDNVVYAVMAETANVTRVEARVATCENDGCIEYWHYTVGGITYYFSDSECANAVEEKNLISPAGHNYQFDSLKWADDGINCKAVFVCDNDESHIDERACVITSKIKTAPTCTTNGITTYTATYTDSERTKTDTKDVTDIPIVDHTWDEGVVIKKATATEKGEKTYTCTMCKATKKEEIAALGAPPVDTVINDDDGKATYKITKSDLKKGTVTYVAPINKKVTKVTVPNTVVIDGVTYKVTAIEKNAFKKNENIKSVTIGVNVKKVGADAFTGCTKLKTVSVKKNVEFIIGRYKYKTTDSSTLAFTGVNSTSLKKVVIEDAVKIGAKKYKVTSVAKKALYNNKKVTSVTIGTNVKTIGSNAFNGCKKLSTIKIESKVLKKVESKAFKGIASKATIKVPAKKQAAYQKLLKNKGQGSKVKIVKY